jgi:hypothetical protein
MELQTIRKKDSNIPLTPPSSYHAVANVPDGSDENPALSLSSLPSQLRGEDEYPWALLPPYGLPHETVHTFLTKLFGKTNYYLMVSLSQIIF